MTKYIYYAHPKCFYGSVEEALCINKILSALPKDNQIANPNSPYYEPYWAAEGMAWFDRFWLPKLCGLVFQPYPDGTVGAGVAHEVNAAIDKGLIIYTFEFRGFYEDLALTIWQGGKLDGLSREETSAKNREFMRGPALEELV